jgi:type II secretory pathway pseudopilin PulG
MRRRKAFSIVELVVVLSILSLLGTLTVWGIGTTIEASKRADTVSRVNVLSSALVEGMQRGMPKQGPWYDAGVRGTHSTRTGSFWKIHRETTVIIPGTPPVTEFHCWPVVLRPGPISETSDLFLNTGIAMRVVAKRPVVDRALSNMPTSTIATYPVVVDTAGGGTVTLQVPFVLDSWNRPLLFCPGSGVFIGTAPPVTGEPVRTSNGATPYLGTDWPTGGMMPFFFSAGPDGDPSTWGDNITP